jgi:hypothetical protein
LGAGSGIHIVFRFVIGSFLLDAEMQSSFQHAIIAQGFMSIRNLQDECAGIVGHRRELIAQDWRYPLSDMVSVFYS